MESRRKYQVEKAFGVHTGISYRCRKEINRIKDNDPDLTEFSPSISDAESFTDSEWELLGGYIAKNEYLQKIGLNGDHTGLTQSLADSNISLLFRELANGGALRRLDLEITNFGIDGVRSMVPFFKTSRNLTQINISENPNFCTDCFRLLVEALHVSGTIQDLLLNSCNIDDITALEHYPLPHLKILTLASNNIQSLSSLENYTNLKYLDFEGNKIGKEGCRSLATLLQKDGLASRIFTLIPPIWVTRRQKLLLIPSNTIHH